MLIYLLEITFGLLVITAEFCALFTAKIIFTRSLRHILGETILAVIGATTPPLIALIISSLLAFPEAVIDASAFVLIPLGLILGLILTYKITKNIVTTVFLFILTSGAYTLLGFLSFFLVFASNVVN